MGRKPGPPLQTRARGFVRVRAGSSEAAFHPMAGYTENAELFKGIILSFPGL